MDVGGALSWFSSTSCLRVTIVWWHHSRECIKEGDELETIEQIFFVFSSFSTCVVPFSIFKQKRNKITDRKDIKEVHTQHDLSLSLFLYFYQKENYSPKKTLSLNDLTSDSCCLQPGQWWINETQSLFPITKSDAEKILNFCRSPHIKTHTTRHPFSIKNYCMAPQDSISSCVEQFYEFVKKLVCVCMCVP